MRAWRIALAKHKFPVFTSPLGTIWIPPFDGVVALGAALDEFGVNAGRRPAPVLRSLRRPACWRGDNVAATLFSLLSALMAGTENPICAEGRMAERVAMGCDRSVASSACIEDPGGFTEGVVRPLGVEGRSNEANDLVSGAGFAGFFASEVISSTSVGALATFVVVSGPCTRS